MSAFVVSSLTSRISIVSCSPLHITLASSLRMSAMVFCRASPLSALFLESVISMSTVLVLWIFSTVVRTCSSGTDCLIQRRISAYFSFSAERMIRASGLMCIAHTGIYIVVNERHGLVESRNQS
ncbi:Protein of unknown function [Cotesia congregata]|uniref:Uncharacterized protein n=1 Tax=Cotesia congregata TaxID=51543 RepID=A0A8J2E0V1_COTCN|nr:Protein of unknown function [Cotesia congregata]